MNERANVAKQHRVGWGGLALFVALAWAGDASAQDFSGQDLSEAIFDRLDLSGADFSEAILSETQFTNCDLSGANFSGAQLDSTLFAQTNLQGAIFDRSFAAVGPAFIVADLQNASAAPVSWRNAVIRQSECASLDFTASTLIDVEISDSVCTGANLTLIDGTAGNFSGTDFTDASFDRAIVAEASFDGANLTRANFVNADIRGVNFTGVITEGIQF